MSLEEVFIKYGVPDSATVQYLEKNGVSLAYVSHAQITKALCEIDPNWTWEPALGADGLPAIRIQHGEIRRRDKPPMVVDMATMWGRLTLCGVTRWAVGSVEAHKPDLDKELVSDFLRNAAMRFGVALSLWMKDGVEPSTKPVSNKPAWKQRDAERTIERAAFEGTKTIVNKMPGKCGRCGLGVNTGAGKAVNDGSGWKTFHNDGDCPADEEPF